MNENDRLAGLIIDQIQCPETDEHWDGRNRAIAALLEKALESGPSRLDLRKRLMTKARATNAVTYRDVADAISESLGDRIRDLDHSIGKLENDLVPSRLAMSTIIGLMVGALGSVIYGAADVLTAMGVSGAMVAAFMGLQAYRKRAFFAISTLKSRKANYEGFRNLLRHDP